MEATTGTNNSTTTSTSIIPGVPAILAEYTKTLQRFKLPGLDLATFGTSLIASRRKDLAALASVNLVILDGVQAFGQKQLDIARGAVSGVQARLLEPAGAGVPAASGAVGLARDTLQKSLASLRELSGIAQKTQSDCIATVNKRLAENAEEAKALFKPAQ